MIRNSIYLILLAVFLSSVVSIACKSKISTSDTSDIKTAAEILNSTGIAMQSISSFLLVNIAASSYVKQKENERKLKRVVVGRAANESGDIQYETGNTDLSKQNIKVRTKYMQYNRWDSKNLYCTSHSYYISAITLPFL